MRLIKLKYDAFTLLDLLLSPIEGVTMSSSSSRESSQSPQALEIKSSYNRTYL
jgi:hypothetical protein